MGKPAARLGDSTMHGSPLLGAPCPTVLIGGKPAWRIGDQHTCPIPNAPPPACSGTPHGPGITTPVPDGGSGVCLIGGKPAARMGDIVMEPGALIPLPPPNSIVAGCVTVLIGMVGGSGGAGGGAASGQCTQEGHPVNVANGEVTANATDLDLPGLIAIELERRYASRRAEQSGDFGYGWSHNLGHRIVVRADDISFFDPEERELKIALPPIDQATVLEFEGISFTRGATAWTINTPSGRDLVFPAPRPNETTIYPELLRDAYGAFWRFEYAAGRLVALVDTARRYVLLERDELGRIVVLRIADQSPSAATILRRYEYDSRGDLVAVEDAVGNKTRYEYQDHYLVRETDRNGNSWCFNYDREGRCHETWGPGGLLYRRFHFAPGDARRTLMVDARGHQWVYDHNEDGLVTQLTTPLGYREEMHWSPNRELLGHTNRDGDADAIEYGGPHRNISQITDAAGNVWAFEYDARGHETKFIDPQGAIAEKTYDTRGSLLSYRDPLGNLTHYATDERGLLDTITLPDGKSMRYTYDRYGFLASCQSDDGLYRESYVHDFRGRLLERVFPDGNRAVREYDAENRLTRITDSVGLVWEVELDGEGNVRVYRDGTGNIWRRRVDALGAVLEEIGPSADANQPLAVTRYEYDGESQLTRIVLPNRETLEYTYDADRRLTEVVYPDQRRVALFYHGEEEVVERRNSDGSRACYTRDPLGRISSKVLFNSRGDRQEYTYAYDAYGRVLLAQSEDHTSEWEFDACGRTTLERQDGRQFRYRYDALGRRVGMVFPDLAAVDYRFDDSTRTMTIASALHGDFVYDYDGLYRPERVRYPNGLTETFGYDARSQLASQIVSRGDGHRFGRTYRRSVGGWTQQETDLDGANRLAEHGGLARVLRLGEVGSDGASLELSYSFDVNNNLLASPDGGDWEYGPGNRLLAALGRRFDYDGRGDLVRVESARGATRYEYDAEGLLLRADLPDGTVVEFTYDGLGRRMTKTVGGAKTRFYWDSHVPALEVTVERTTHYLFLLNTLAPVARHDWQRTRDGRPTTATYVMHVDSIGATREITDERGEVVWSATYGPLGEAYVASDSAITNPLRVIGEYWDEELGLGYHRLRYYDPATGRFLSPDPQDVVGGLNLYVFQGNAFDFFDPFGESPWAYVAAWGRGYENFLTATTPGAQGGHFYQPTSLGPRNYDGYLPKSNTYVEAKYIGAGGPSKEAMSRMRGQLNKDSAFLKGNKGAKVKWVFNKEPPASIKKRMRELQKKYPGRFSWTIKATPPCFKATYVDPELAKIT